MSNQVHILRKANQTGSSLCKAPHVSNAVNASMLSTPYVSLDKWTFKDDLCKDCKALWIK